jgi:alkylhydroperoxidase/carboxymuconolactone decarboxylase family protein YurZ
MSTTTLNSFKTFKSKEREFTSILLKRMKNARYGSLLPVHKFIAEKDPEFTEAYENLFEFLMSKERFLPVKTKEFIAIGILASKGQFDALDTHIRRALQINASLKEILEVLEVSMLYGGTESLIFGARYLERLKNKQ